VTLDMCSFITASHRVTNRGTEGKERVNISCGLENGGYCMIFYVVTALLRKVYVPWTSMRCRRS